METGRNNKRPCSASNDEETPKRPRVDEGDDRNVTDEEVEEFYTILRRIREASRGRAVRNGSRGGTAGGGRGGAASWVPAFKWEDFGEGGAVKVNGTETPTNEAETSGGERRKRAQVAEDETVTEDDGRCLDLNAEPDVQSAGRFKVQTRREVILPSNYYLDRSK